MKITDILTETGHRPWKLPSGYWKYYQEWNQAVFLHWKVDSELMKPHTTNILGETRQVLET